jgi:hypothetical protein
MKETDSEKGSFGFYGLEQEGRGQFLIVTCNKRDSYFLEVAKNQELARITTASSFSCER